MEEMISIRDVTKILRKRWGIIALITILAVALTAAISYYLLTPQYQATTQILVNKESKDRQTQFQDTQTDLQLINTYNVIIKSPVILNQVINNLYLDTKASQLNGKIEVNNEQNSKVMTVVVTDTKPEQAVAIANEVANVFEKEVKKMMKVDNVNILMPAELSDSLVPVKPNPELNMAIALVIGLMAGIGMAFLLEYLDKTFKSEKEVEEMLGLPVLGVISVMPKMKKSKSTVPRQSETEKREVVS
ncbi:YveK family protein [Rummeliibacillus sp. JY-2-4R]